MNKYRLYRFYIVILVFLGVLCGCNEDEFLKEEPRASLYPENLLVDYDGFKSMNISLYGIARAEYRRADALGGSIPLVLHSVWDGGTDVAWGNNSHSEVQYMYNPKLIDQTDKQVFRNVFQWCYRIINTANGNAHCQFNLVPGESTPEGFTLIRNDQGNKTQHFAKVKTN